MMTGKMRYNMEYDKIKITTRIILRAMLPAMKILVADDPVFKKRFENISATIQFKANDGETSEGACLKFDQGELEIQQGLYDNPDITFGFSSLAQMNAFFGGKLVLPRISGITNVILTFKVFSLLLGMKILMPNVRPEDPEKKRLKVKMSFYMITTALSQYNKGGDPEMVKWTQKQPDRVYQISVDDTIAAYLRVKAGNSKAGRGIYTKKRPFVHLKFNGVDGAFPVVMNDVDMVSAVRNGYLVIEGSPEYGADLGNFMDRIQNLLVA